MGNQKGLLQNFDVKFTNGRADWRTNERIIGRNDEEMYTYDIFRMTEMW